MSRLVTNKKYGKLEGKVVDISTAIFFNFPRLNQYYNEITIEKKVEGKYVSTRVRVRKTDCTDVKIGSYFNFENMTFNY